jgi:hypothetical protein
MSIYCNDDLHLGVVCWGWHTIVARIQVGHVKVETKIVPHNFDLEWH